MIDLQLILNEFKGSNLATHREILYHRKHIDISSLSGAALEKLTIIARRKKIHREIKDSLLSTLDGKVSKKSIFIALENMSSSKAPFAWLLHHAPEEIPANEIENIFHALVSIKNKLEELDMMKIDFEQLTAYVG